MKHELLTKAELAERFGKDERTITNWMQAGMPSRTRAGKLAFAWLQCLEWREKQIERAAKEGSQKDSELEQKIRAERKLKEFELAEKQRELVPAAESESFVTDFVGAFAAVASGRLQRFERDIVNATDPAAARRLTQRMHVALMEGAQDYAAQLEAEAQTLEGPTPPTDPPSIAAA